MPGDLNRTNTSDASQLIQKDFHHWVDVIHGPMTAWIVLAFSLIITLIAWTISSDYAEQRAEERFEYKTEEAQDAIYKRFINYEQVLRGGLGLFKASSKVERSEWHDYISILEIDKYFPGTLGVGYAQWLEPSELTDHIQTIRKQGFSDYTVRPDGEREQYSSIIFLEPFNERNKRAFGYDMYSEPVRREAMARARDSGATALSGKVTLVQESSSAVQAGFLIYIPVFHYEVNTLEDRRKALQGFVYSALRIGDLMQGILGVGIPEIDFAIYDGATTNSESLLYETDESRKSDSLGPASGFQQQKVLDIAGHKWTIVYRSNQTFDQATSSSQPTLVAIGGIVIDFLLFNIILSLGRLRKRAQSLADERMKKLRERELQFQAITDNANDGIISMDDLGKVSYINNSAQRMFGYNPHSLLGKSVTVLFPVGDQSAIRQALGKQGQDNDHESNVLLELDGVSAGGKCFPIEFSLACWRAGDAVHFTAIVRDITERKKIEKIKNEFISTVSHELRTPLTAISGSLSLVESGVTGGVGEKTLELIKNASRNTGRLARLVNDLLDSEKMASGTMRYEMRECELSELVEKALDINRALAEQAHISLIFAERAKASVVVDPDRFVQVMTNLLANAIKFSYQDQSIETSLKIMGDYVRVSVTDHGEGIPDEFRHQIFNKFAQADSSDTRKHGGTGLGLSIVKFIITKFNGQIDYTSIPNKETCFFFTLPLTKH